MDTPLTSSYKRWQTQHLEAATKKRESLSRKKELDKVSGRELFVLREFL
jgi:hypothetical protein